uniref:Uncharacterized protein n=1 Tax=Scophthalmus maximus TaxID=52904 RepID=A0A8D3DSN0_SCOMX
VPTPSGKCFGAGWKRKNSPVFMPVVKSLHELWASLGDFRNHFTNIRAAP